MSTAQPEGRVGSADRTLLLEIEGEGGFFDVLDHRDLGTTCHIRLTYENAQRLKLFIGNRGTLTVDDGTVFIHELEIVAVTPESGEAKANITG